jgi:hypothetical protein
VTIAWIRRAALIALLWCPSGADAGGVLTLRASPPMAFAPADVLVTVALDCNADDRQLEIVLDSSAVYRASTVDLEGDHSPPVHDLLFRQLPAGRYEVTARLTDARGHERAWARRFVVLM